VAGGLVGFMLADSLYNKEDGSRIALYAEVSDLNFAKTIRQSVQPSPVPELKGTPPCLETKYS
jgi:hypothetical protein